MAFGGIEPDFGPFDGFGFRVWVFFFDAFPTDAPGTRLPFPL